LSIHTNEPAEPTDGFSIVIPAHNESLLLAKTLKSVNTAAHSTGRDFGVIVVDDDSTDNTSEIALENGPQVVHVAKRTIAAVRNGRASQNLSIQKRATGITRGIGSALQTAVRQIAFAFHGGAD